MANPFPFVAGEVLTAADMNGIGEWTSYTPTMTATVTNPTIGNSVLTGRYARVQNLVIANFSVTVGSTFVVGSGDYLFALPIGLLATKDFNKATFGVAAFFDASTNNYYSSNPWTDATDKVRGVYRTAFNGTMAGWSNVNPVIPATGDVYSGLLIYEAA